MSLLRIVKHKDHCIEVKLPRSMTFSSINQSDIFEQIIQIKKMLASEIIINCAEVKDIDSCGLAVITYIQKLYSKIDCKMTEQSNKIEKLSQLYLNTKDTYENRSH